MMIDAHHHFWQPARGDYHWMAKDNQILNRPYYPADLAPHLSESGIQATMLIQAAPSLNESEYLLGLSDATSYIAGVTGWVDFDRPADIHDLKRLSQHPKFKAVRPMIQDINDDNWMLGEAVQWGYRAVIELGLRFEALGFPRHLENFLTLFKCYPDMQVVINHGMKPSIGSLREQDFSHWADGMARLAGETGAYCKLSGLVSEAGEEWTIEALRPYVRHIIMTFGADRVMWGSDWPVCLLRTSYAKWWQAAHILTSELTDADKKMIFGGTAKLFYGLDG